MSSNEAWFHDPSDQAISASGVRSDEMLPARVDAPKTCRIWTRALGASVSALAAAALFAASFWQPQSAGAMTPAARLAVSGEVPTRAVELPARPAAVKAESGERAAPPPVARAPLPGLRRVSLATARRVALAPPAAGQGVEQAWMRRGAAYMAASRFADALGAYVVAARLAPKNPEAWFGVGLACIELKRDGSAQIAVDRALRAQPDHAMATLLKGNIAQLRGDRESARTQYARYLELDSDGAWASEVRVVLKEL